MSLGKKEHWPFHPHGIQHHRRGDKGPWLSNITIPIIHLSVWLCGLNYTMVYDLGPPNVHHSVTFTLTFVRKLTVTERVDLSARPTYVHNMSVVSQTVSFQLLVRVLPPITYRNELIGSFNTFCTCIRPTGRLMSGIPLLFVREDALVPCLL